MQEEVDINHALDRYQNSLIERLKNCFKQAKSIDDILYFLTSSNGKWIFSNPLLDADDKANLLTLATKQLNQRLMRIDSDYRCNNDETNIYFYINNAQVITWKITTNQVKIPLFRKMDDNNNRFNDLQLQLKANKSKLLETKIAIEHPDTLLNKGLYIAYLKTIFAKRHYKAESEAIVNNLIEQQAKIKLQLEQETTIKHSLLKEESDLKVLTDHLELLTNGFPYHINYQKYLESKTRMRKNEK